MPNWCYNNVTVNFDEYNEKQLRDALHEEKDLFNQFVTRPSEYDEGEKWYWWNIENWGTKWDAQPRNIEWGEGSVKFTIDTAWGPPVKFYEQLEQEHGYSVDAYYLEEGMAFVGHYCDGFNDYVEYGSMSADEMEEQIPWAEDEFNLISMERDREAEEEDSWDSEEDEEEEYVYIPGTYSDEQKTPWFKVKVSPVHDGQYEVKTKEWPFPHVMDWNGKFWCMADTNSKTQSKVTEWRGLLENAEE